MANWIEACLVHGEGDALGKPVRLAPWQRYVLNRMYEYDPASGKLLYDEVIVGVGKGNSKTELFAHNALARLFGPVAPVSPKIVLSAAAWMQTKRLFGAATLAITAGPLRAIVPDECLLEDRIIIPAPLAKRLGLGHGQIERVAAVAGTNDGGLESDHDGDEIHEWLGERRERVWIIYGNALAKRSPATAQHFPLTNGMGPLIGHQQRGITTAGDSMDSLAGRLYAKGVRVAKGEEADPRFLFLWWEASDHWDLTTEEGVVGALLEANPAAGDGTDPHAFLALDGLVERFGKIPLHEWLRYHGNRFTAAPNSWITFDSWLAKTSDDLLPDGANRLPPEGTEVWIGFRGSSSRDQASLIGITAANYLFEIAGWDRPLSSPEGWIVRETDVNAEIAKAFGRWKVKGMQVDPTRWERAAETWEETYPGIISQVRTEAQQRFAPAAGRFEEAFRTGTLTNDGSESIARQIGNARQVSSAWGMTIGKETKDSPHQITRALAAVLAHDAMTAVAAKTINRTVHSWS